jgi:RNA polymerase sigma factor (sigma-70 family)
MDREEMIMSAHNLARWFAVKTKFAVKTSSTVEDLYQACMVAATIEADRFVPGPAKFTTFLYNAFRRAINAELSLSLTFSISVNSYYDLTDEQKRSLFYSVALSECLDIHFNPDPEHWDEPEVTIDLSVLPEKLLVVIRKHYGIGDYCPWSYSEIAKDLGLAKSTVIERHQKALKILYNHLKQ